MRAVFSISALVATEKEMKINNRKANRLIGTPSALVAENILSEPMLRDLSGD
jgi:hypothetical protein